MLSKMQCHVRIQQAVLMTCRLLLLSEHFTIKAYLAPKLSPSCLGYRDLYLDQQTNRVRAAQLYALR